MGKSKLPVDLVLWVFQGSCKVEPLQDGHCHCRTGDLGRLQTAERSCYLKKILYWPFFSIAAVLELLREFCQKEEGTPRGRSISSLCRDACMSQGLVEKVGDKIASLLHGVVVGIKVSSCHSILRNYNRR